MGTSPCTVDFITTVPRGSHIAMAARRPSGEPVASTTIGNARSAACASVSTSAADARPFDQAHLLPMPAEQQNLRPVRLQHLRDQQPELPVAQHRNFACLSRS